MKAKRMSSLWTCTTSLAVLFLLILVHPVYSGDDYDGPCTGCTEWDDSAHACVPIPNETCSPNDLQTPPNTDNDFPYTETRYWEENIYDMYGFWIGIEDWKAVATGTRNQKEEYRLDTVIPRQSACGGPLNVSVTLPGVTHSFTVGFNWNGFSFGYTFNYTRPTETIQVFDLASQACTRHFGKYALLDRKTTIRLYGNTNTYKEDVGSGSWLLQSGPHAFDTSSDSGWLLIGNQSSTCSAKCSS